MTQAGEPVGYGSPWHTQPIGFPATVATRALAGFPGRLMGWSLVETTGGAPAAFELFDGQDATGQSLGPRTLAANESITDWLGPQGVDVRGGLAIVVTSGSVRGVVYYAMPEHPGAV